MCLSSTLWRNALALVLALGLIWPCPCDHSGSGEHAAEAEEATSSCCVAAGAADEEPEEEDGACPHCSDDTFLSGEEQITEVGLSSASTYPLLVERAELPAPHVIAPVETRACPPDLRSLDSRELWLHLQVVRC